LRSEAAFQPGQRGVVELLADRLHRHAGDRGHVVGQLDPAVATRLVVGGVAQGGQQVRTKG
jgi:hypothetical protein